MPVNPEKPLTTADRVAALADKSKATEATRRPYSLRVVSTKENPAPFTSISVDLGAGTGCSATFAEKTARWGEDDRGRPEIVERKGNVQWLTEAEVAAVRRNVEKLVVRWQNHAAGRALTINADGVALNPMTDERLAPYLVIEGPLSD